MRVSHLPMSSSKSGGGYSKLSVSLGVRVAILLLLMAGGESIPVAFATGGLLAATRRGLDLGSFLFDPLYINIPYFRPVIRRVGL